MEEWLKSILFTVKRDIQSVVKIENRRIESHLLDIKITLSKIEERLANLEQAKNTTKEQSCSCYNQPQSPHQLQQSPHQLQQSPHQLQQSPQQPLRLSLEEEPLSICVSDEELPQFKPPKVNWDNIFDDNDDHEDDYSERQNKKNKSK